MCPRTGPRGVTSARALAVTALSVLLFACGKDKATEPRGDTTPPAAVTDLACVDSSGDSITLHWTAPGDNGSSGQAARYDLRYLHSMITTVNWDSAAPVLTALAASAPGSNETYALYDRTWWTTYYFALKTADSAGNWSAISNVATATLFPDSGLRLIIQTRIGTFTCDAQKRVARFVEAGGEVEVFGERIFLLTADRVINEYDARGTLANAIPIIETTPAAGFVALPNNRFALLDNVRDAALVIDDRGRTLATVPLRAQADDSRQNVRGVAAGSSLIVSEDGQGRILQIDLQTYPVTILKDLSGLATALGDIDYYRDRYYLNIDQEIYSFADGSNVAIVGVLDQLAISGIAVAGGYSFVTVEESGAIYRLNNSSHTVDLFVNGLDHPQDIEILDR